MGVACLLVTAPVMAMADLARSDIAAQPQASALETGDDAASIRAIHANGEAAPSSAVSPASKQRQTDGERGTDGADDSSGHRFEVAQATSRNDSAESVVPEATRAGVPPARVHEPAAASLEEVVVTGTHIERPGFEAPTPTMVMTVDELNLVGVTSPGDIAFHMPQFAPSQNVFTNNLSVDAGSNYFNLRNLGQNRTLTLVDSQRQTPTDLIEGLDVNQIPGGIIERVEVVTGGASAAYGSDAVAGVVNLILRKDIEGFEGSIQGGESTYHDNRNWKGTLNFGSRFANDRGHFMIATEFGANDGILAVGSRPWGRVDGVAGWALIPNPAYAAGNGQYPYAFLPNTRGADRTSGGLILDGALAGTEFLPGGIPAKFNSGVLPFGNYATSGGDGPQVYPSMTLEVPTRRNTVYSRISFDVSDRLLAYFTVNYADTYSNLAHQFPSSLGSGFTNITIQSDNAYLPASSRAALQSAGESSFTMSRLTDDFPWFGNVNRTRYQQFAAGLDGKMGQTWSWKARIATGIYGRTEDYAYDTNLAHAALAIDAVLNPANGQVVCRSTLTAPTNGCVPINLFGAGSASQQAIQYVSDSYRHAYRIRQDMADVSIQGEPISTWAGPVSVAVGGEYRREAILGRFDPLTIASGHGIYNAPDPGTATIKVTEGFAETVVPLLKDKPWAHEVDLNGAVRATHYNTVGEATTWKLGITHNITDGLRLRAARSRDIRAPNFNELEVTAAPASMPVMDINGQVTQAAVYTRANPNLTSEVANTWTAGIAYALPSTRALQASVDYFDTKIYDSISSYGAQDVVNGCGLGNATLCSSIIRDASGRITTVYAGEFNGKGFGKTNGIDADVSYIVPVDALFASFPGNVLLRSQSSYLLHNIISSVLGQPTEHVHDVPNLRSNASVTYSNAPLVLSVTGEYQSKTCADCYLLSNFRAYYPASAYGGYSASVIYLHAGLEYSLLDRDGWSLKIFGNVNNILNRDPPRIPDFSGGWVNNLGFNNYDVIGRTYLLGVRFKL